MRIFWVNGNFSNPPAEIRDSNMVLKLSTISLLVSHCLWVQSKFTWSRKDVGSPKSTSLLSTFHIGSRFCFLPANLWDPHTQIRTILFSRWTKRHSQFGIFSYPCFTIVLLKKDDRTNSFQEERLGLPYWTMILAICVVVDESKCLDTPIWEFSIICEHLPFSLRYTLILRLLLVHRNLAIWRWYPWS